MITRPASRCLLGDGGSVELEFQAWALAVRATWPLTTCTRAEARPTLETSSHERHQSGPHPDQTQSYPGSRDISAHRSSPSRFDQDGDRVRMTL